MKKLIPIILTTVITNIVIIPILSYTKNLPAEDIPFWDNIMTCIWSFGIITSIVLVIIYRKYLFKKAWTAICVIVLIIFTTPIPFLFIYLKFINPTTETVLVSEDYYYPYNQVHKTEHWEYSWGWGDMKYVNKKFICDSAEFAVSGDRSKFKKDSIWIYFKKNGDTLKVEKYKDGKLVSIVTY